MEEIKFFESAFFPPEFGELICIVFKACGVFFVSMAFLCIVWSFCFVGFGWFCWVAFAGWGEAVEPFLDLENS